jgi:transcriptional regulator with XRE-family HTH domain
MTAFLLIHHSSTAHSCKRIQISLYRLIITPWSSLHACYSLNITIINCYKTNMQPGGRTSIENRLWQTRKRRGLEQKQVAYLLNHHTADQVSRYELGTRLPTLETALLLEMIYGAPLRVLYKDLYERLQAEFKDRLERLPQLHERLSEFLGEDGVREYCAYRELIQSGHPAQSDLLKARRHVTELAKRLAYL